MKSLQRELELQLVLHVALTGDEREEERVARQVGRCRGVRAHAAYGALLCGAVRGVATSRFASHRSAESARRRHQGIRFAPPLHRHHARRQGLLRSGHYRKGTRFQLPE